MLGGESVTANFKVYGITWFAKNQTHDFPYSRKAQHPKTLRFPILQESTTSQDTKISHTPGKHNIQDTEVFQPERLVLLQQVEIDQF